MHRIFINQSTCILLYFHCNKAHFYFIFICTQMKCFSAQNKFYRFSMAFPLNNLGFWAIHWWIISMWCFFDHKWRFSPKCCVNAKCFYIRIRIVHLFLVQYHKSNNKYIKKFTYWKQNKNKNSISFFATNSCYHCKTFTTEKSIL